MEHKVIAVVDGREITEEHLRHLVQTIGAERMRQFQGEQGKQQLIKELINQELFYSHAIENNLQDDEDYLREVEIVTGNLLKSYAIRQFLNEIEVSDEEAKKYYEAHRAKFVQPESVKAQHILVDSEEKAQSIKREIAEGTTFEEAAKQYSTCPSKERGGDLGVFTRGQMVPEFEAAAFALEPDVVSQPVKTQFGYHLINITEKMAEREKTYEQAKQEVVQQVMLNKQQAAYQKKIEDLKSKYNVEIK